MHLGTSTIEFVISFPIEWHQFYQNLFTNKEVTQKKTFDFEVQKSRQLWRHSFHLSHFIHIFGISQRISTVDTSNQSLENTKQ